AHFVSHVIDVEPVADRVGRAGDAVGLAPGDAHDPEAGDPATAGAENVTDVIVSAADHAIQGGLVLAEHGRSAVVVVRVAIRVRVNDSVVIRYQDQANRQFRFIHPVDSVDGGNDPRQARGNRPALELGVFAGGSAGQAIGAQGAAGRQQRSERNACRGGIRGASRQTLKIAGGALVVVFIKGHMQPRVPSEVRLDIDRAQGRKDLRMETSRREVETDRGQWIVDAGSQVSFDFREFGGQLGGHYWRINKTKPREAAIRHRQGNDRAGCNRSSPGFAWSGTQYLADRSQVQVEGAESIGSHPEIGWILSSDPRIGRNPKIRRCGILGAQGTEREQRKRDEPKRRRERLEHGGSQASVNAQPVKTGWARTFVLLASSRASELLSR